jgi:hypothetical protein
MKKTLVILLVIGIVGCASNTQKQPLQIEIKPSSLSKLNIETENRPIYKLRNYEGPEALDNNEVISLARQCISLHLRPRITYLSVRTDQGKLQVPVSVMCENFQNQNILN